MSLASYLRPAKGRRPPLKEKFVAVYESFFDGSAIPPTRQTRRFWDELFLLRVNAPFLVSLIRGVSEERLFACRASVSEICGECVSYLHDPNLLRVSHALETLIIVLQYVARKRFAEKGLGVINVVAGGQGKADEFFSQLLNGCATIMANHELPVALRRLAVRLLLVIATGTDNINQNALVGYFMLYPLYEPIMKVLVAPTNVPGGGKDSTTAGMATALCHGPAGFGNDEPKADVMTLDDFLANGGVQRSSGREDPRATRADVNPSTAASKPRGRPAVGTTEERERLREEAAYLLALMLSWRESTNVYVQTLAAGDGVELSVLLRAACALLSVPSRPREDGTAGGRIGERVSSGSAKGGLLGGFFGGGGLPPPPDNLVECLVSWLKYDAPQDGGEAWELLPGPCAGLLLLHGLMAHSNLLHMPAAWLRLMPKPTEMLHGVPIGHRWHEALGRVMCFTHRLCSLPSVDKQADGVTAGESEASTAAASPPSSPSWLSWLTGGGHAKGGVRARGNDVAGHSSRGGFGGDTDTAEARADFAGSQALLSLALLRQLLDDKSAAEFLHATDISRLAPDNGASSGAGSNPIGGVGGGGGYASRPVAAAVLELLASLLAKGAPGVQNGSAPVTVESHAVYVIHRLLQTQVAQGGRPLVFRWERLWEGLINTMTRCSVTPEVMGRPHVATLVSQAVNLTSFCLVHRGSLCAPVDDVIPLVEALVSERGMLARVAHGAAAHGYLVDDHQMESTGGRGGKISKSIGAGSPAARRAGVRMENIHYVQNHFKPVHAERMRTAVLQGMSLLDLPVRDRLEAGWALHTAVDTGGGFGGGGGGGVGGLGPAAKTDRVVANSTRELVGKLLKGVVGGVPEGLHPAVPPGH